MGKLTSTHLAYGFAWDTGKMPSREIMDLLSEDEQEDILDVDREMNLNWENYDMLSFQDFSHLMKLALNRITVDGRPFPMLEMMTRGMDEGDGYFQHACFVLKDTHRMALGEELINVPTDLVENRSRHLQEVINRYFPGAEQGWVVWASVN